MKAAWLSVTVPATEVDVVWMRTGWYTVPVEPGIDTRDRCRDGAGLLVAGPDIQLHVASRRP